MARDLIQGDFGIEFPLKVIAPKTRGSRHVWYKPNHRSFGAFIRSEQMRDPVAAAAHDIATEATASVPAPSPDTDPDAAEVSYRVKREAGLVRLSGNTRVRVLVEGDGLGAQRAEFGGHGGEQYRNLAKTASRYGDWRPFREEGK